MYYYNLPAGETIIPYEFLVIAKGTFNDIIIQCQSHYAPELVANTAGGRITIE